MLDSEWKFFFKIYSCTFQRERESTRENMCASMCEWGQGQRERKRDSSQADTLLNAEPYMGLNPWTLRS